MRSTIVMFGFHLSYLHIITAPQSSLNNTFELSSIEKKTFTCKTLQPSPPLLISPSQCLLFAFSVCHLLFTPFVIFKTGRLFEMPVPASPGVTYIVFTKATLNFGQQRWGIISNSVWRVLLHCLNLIFRFSACEDNRQHLLILPGLKGQVWKIHLDLLAENGRNWV